MAPCFAHAPTGSAEIGGYRSALAIHALLLILANASTTALPSTFSRRFSWNGRQDPLGAANADHGLQFRASEVWPGLAKLLAPLRGRLRPKPRVRFAAALVPLGDRRNMIKLLTGGTSGIPLEQPSSWDRPDNRPQEMQDQGVREKWIASAGEPRRCPARTARSGLPGGRGRARRRR